MSINTKMDTITVNGVTYDVERQTNAGFPVSEYLTLALDGEPVFEGLRGALGYEEDGGGMSPRDWSNVGTMAVSYPRYNLGDEDISRIDFEVDCEKCEGEGSVDVNGPVTERAASYGVVCPAYSCEHCDGRGTLDINPIDYFKKECGARVVIPLTVYEHSGISMSAGDVTYPWDTDRWDTSFVGFIYDTPEKVKECMGDDVSDEEIIKCLESEVKVYSAYLEGDITWWRVEDDETNYDEGCGGYVGDSDYCEEECFRSMVSAVESRLAEQQERAHWAARDTVTA